MAKETLLEKIEPFIPLGIVVAGIIYLFGAIENSVRYGNLLRQAETQFLKKHDKLSEDLYDQALELRYGASGLIPGHYFISSKARQLKLALGTD